MQGQLFENLVQRSNQKHSLIINHTNTDILDDLININDKKFYNPEVNTSLNL